MEIYILFVFIIIALLFIDFKANFKILRILAILVIIAFSAFRYNVGYDYQTYEYIFSNNIKLEVGFNFIVNIFHLIGNNVKFVFAFFSISTILFVVNGIRKHSINERMSLFLYIMIPGLFLSSLTTIRQSLAMAILFYGYNYYLKKKPIKFLIFAIIACLFHYSAGLVLVVIVLVHKIKMSSKFIWFILISSLFIGSSGILNKVLADIANGGYMNYFNDNVEANLFKLFVTNIFMMYILYYRNEIVEFRNINVYYIKMIVVGTVILNLFSTIPFVIRFGYYFKIYEIIVIPDFLYMKRKKAITIMFMVFYISTFVYCLFIDINGASSRGGLSNLIPYKTIFGN
ncbi:EpsG family protein [Clostridium estertheticum]|uniref:EpsG family protein n=1 Tax=Clostridium estertheticum TaxID=238834 RepID=UPI001CF422BA|nr:EpsG family protein [Clostridium estertheticum]MCB2357869.1 EpsG family protein [Clostridium estertheticum]